MSTEDNLIYLENYRKELKPEKNKKKSSKKASASVQSIERMRKEIISEERRKVKRTILTQFVGASLVLPGSGLVKATLNDISLAGLSFDLPKKYGHFKQDESIFIRIYLNNETYFSLAVDIKNINFVKPEQVYRHGTKYVEGAVNEEAIYHFIRFMESVNTSLRLDKGDLVAK